GLHMARPNREKVRSAASDFLYLLNRGYPRAPSLQLVGNRYNLDAMARNLLHRGVFAREEARRRRARLVGVDQLRDDRLLVDGHNVLITTESALAGRPLIAANDGVIRDIAGISHRYRLSSLTHEATVLIFQVLHSHPPRETLFYLDAPIRHSGELAGMLRACLKRWKLPGNAQALKVPERHLTGAQGIVASSDSAVLDKIRKGCDLAAAVIYSLTQPVELISFLGLDETGSVC
ncbi:MAG: DUF434 domain-containing protein, partial [Syntrophobacteria bacterium]